MVYMMYVHGYILYMSVVLCKLDVEIRKQTAGFAKV